MKNKFILILSPIIALIGYLTLTSYSTGVNVVGYYSTGCTSCHGTTATAGTSVTLSGLPSGGYTNGTSYSVTITVTNTSVVAVGTRLAGFDMKCVGGGTFTVGSGTALNSSTEIRHSGVSAASTGTKSWTFTWTAPVSGTSNITFNMAGNMGNGDGFASALDKWNVATVSLPHAVVVTASSSPAITCNGGTTTITATASGGSAPFQYKLNTGAFQSSNIFPNTLAGTYTVTAMSSTSVTASTIITVNQPSAVSFSSVIPNSPLCNGSLGSAQVTATGGTGLTKTYTINPLGPQTNTTGNFTGLTAQTYTVTVSDANNCTKTTTFSISTPSALILGTATINNPLCYGGVGSVNILASGGTGNKSYSITPLGPQTNSTGNFTGLTAQFYTVTVTDDNNCSSTTNLSITQPAIISFNSPIVTNPTCNNYSDGLISVTANGGVGTLNYSISPLGPQTNTSGNFSGLSGQLYTVTCSDINNCVQTASISVTNPAPISVTSSNVSGCQGSPISLIGSPAGGSFSIANPYLGPSTQYTYTYTNGNGCTNTSTPSSVTVVPVSNSNIVMPSSTSYCETLTQITGNNQYSNSSCELITNISASGLGNTLACIDFLPGTPNWNGEPYANRVYSITPDNQPSSTATVCLYYTPTDLAAAGISNNADISITKVGGNGILGGSGSVTEITNSSMIINNLFGGNKEVCFPVTSFSSFYLHSKNPNNIPLPVQIHNLRAEIIGDIDMIKWQTSEELNIAFYNIQLSKDGIHFETIGTVESKSSSSVNHNEFEYSFSNQNPSNGYNFYRLEQVDLSRQTAISSVVSLYRSLEENHVLIYPNPTSGEFNIESELPISLHIIDMNGKQVFHDEKIKRSQIKLYTAGVYFIKLTDMNGKLTIRKLIVN